MMPFMRVAALLMGQLAMMNNNAIVSAASASASASAAAADDANIQVEQCICESSPTDVERIIVFYLEGEEEDDTSGTSGSAAAAGSASFVDALEETFVSACNRQSFAACDLPHFRTIRSATRMARDRVSAISRTSTGSASTSSVMLKIQAGCRNCTSSIPLFELLPEEATEPAHCDNGTEVDNSTLPVFNNSTLPMLYNGTLDAFNTTNVTATSRTTFFVNNNNKNCAEASCVCEVGALPSPEPLTKESLPRQLNENLEEMMELPTSKVLDMVELQTIPCGGSVKTFSSFVCIDFNVLSSQGQNWDVAERELELAAMEEAFVQAHSKMTFGSCDRHFRTVLNVVLDLDLEKEILADGEDTMRGTATFAAEANCKNCTVSDTGSFPLFDGKASTEFLSKLTQCGDEVSTPKAKSPTLASFGHRNLQDNLCLCPLEQFGDGSSSLLSMSQDDFVDLCNEELVKLREGGEVQVVESVQAIGEGQTVNCSADLKEFESIVYSGVKVNLSSLTMEEATRLERVFINSYNGRK